MESTNKKKDISDAYIRLLKIKDGDKITVKSLIQECGVSRQTFYYHFIDIIDVVDYTIRTILDETSIKCKKIDEPRDAIKLIFNMVYDNKYMIIRLENTSHSKDFKKYVVNSLCDLIKDVLGKKQPEKLDGKRRDIDFMLQFYSHGILGCVLDKIENNQLNVEEITEHIYKMLRGEFVIIS